MEAVDVALSAEKFDAAVHGNGVDPVLPECGDLAFYFKPNATAGGRPALVITFGVRLPDGSLARAQAVTTLNNFEAVAALVRGWKSGGHL
jgi:hypothetical protein